MRKLILMATGLALVASSCVFLFIERVWPIAIPIVLALLPFAAPKQSQILCRVAAALMFVFVILGAWTVGLLYLPSAILLLIAGSLDPLRSASAT